MSYTDEYKHKQMLEAAEALDNIDDSIAKARAIQQLPFEFLSPETWAMIQKENVFLEKLLLVVRESIPLGAKVLNDDALHAHIDAVMSAD